MPSTLGLAGSLARILPRSFTGRRGVVRWALLFVLAGPSAFAGAPEVEQARALFNVGAQAYEKGSYPAALEAFEAAYRLAPRPGILFSIAQAHRRQYHLSHEDSHLRDAVRLYREYLDKVKEGERRADAAQALVELEPLAARLAPISEEQKETEPRATARTRIMVSSAAEGATIALDGGRPQGSPVIADVASGRHKVQVVAPGFVTEDREVVAVEGGLVAIDVLLRERPARLLFRGPPDSEVSVDQRLLGRTPLSGPLEVPAGKHVLWLSRAGYQPRRILVDVSRGEQRTITFDFDPSAQRVASEAFLIASGVALVAGGAFTAVALVRNKQAEDLLQARTQRNLTPSEVRDYDSARSGRDTFRTAAIASFGATLGLAATWAGLYLFDKPVQPPPELDQYKPQRSVPDRSNDKKTLELSFAPSYAPGLFSVSARGTF